MTMTTPAPAEAVTALLEQFRWMADPSVDPIRTKIRQFFVDYIHSKGRGGATIAEGQTAFTEAVARDPQSWPVPADRLQALWRDTTRVLNDSRRWLAPLNWYGWASKPATATKNHRCSAGSRVSSVYPTRHGEGVSRDERLPAARSNGPRNNWAFFKLGLTSKRPRAGPRPSWCGATAPMRWALSRKKTTVANT